MAELQGSAAKLAYKKAVTWGTAVTLNGGDQFAYASETVTPEVSLVDSDQITGAALPGPSDTGAITVIGAVQGADLVYWGDERFLRDVFGDYAESDIDVPNDERLHTFNFVQSNEGFFGTLAIEKVVTGPHEVDTFKPMSFIITGEPNNFVKGEIGGIGRQLRTKDPGRTNDASTTWTLPASSTVVPRNKIKFGQVTIGIGEAAATPTYVAYCANSFTLSFVRNTEPAPTTCDGDYSSEPSTDTVEITGEFGFPIYDTANDVLLDFYLSKAVLAAKITFDSGIVLGNGPNNYKWVIYIPSFQLTDPGYPNVPGLGRVPVSFPWRASNGTIAVTVDTAPAITMPRIYIYNTIQDIDDYTVI